LVTITFEHGPDFVDQPIWETGLGEERVTPCGERTLFVGLERARTQDDDRGVMRGVAVSKAADQLQPIEWSIDANAGDDDIDGRRRMQRIHRIVYFDRIQATADAQVFRVHRARILSRVYEHHGRHVREHVSGHSLLLSGAFSCQSEGDSLSKIENDRPVPSIRDDVGPSRAGRFMRAEK
jgi:hypothetical protein